MRRAEIADVISVLMNDLAEDSLKRASQQLYCIHLLCRRHPLTAVVNGGENEGFKARRKLVECYEPSVRPRIAGQLLHLPHFAFAGDVEDRL
eukprot:8725269-Pyramimonas_sp.AAC.1